MNLNERLKLVRKSLGMSQAEISKVIGSSVPAWQAYESGKNVPGGKILEALVRLGFNVNWVLTGDGQIRFSDGGQSINGSSNIQVGGSVSGTVLHGNILRSSEVEELCELLEKYGTKTLKENLRIRLLQIKEAVEG